MNKTEFKRTIEYKTRTQVIKEKVLYLVISLILYLLLCWVYLLFYRQYKNFSLLLSFLITGFVELIIALFFITIIIVKYGDLKDIYKNLNGIYIFNFQPKKAIEEKFGKLKYLVKFDYENIHKEMLTNWIISKDALAYKEVTFGYIENLNIIVCLDEYHKD